MVLSNAYFIAFPFRQHNNLLAGYNYRYSQFTVNFHSNNWPVGSQVKRRPVELIAQLCMCVYES